LLTEELLKELLSKKEFSNTDKILFCLAESDFAPKKVADIRALATRNGLRAIKDWNVSQLLARSGKALSIAGKWELSGDGKSHTNTLIGPFAATPVQVIAPALRTHLTKITNPDVRLFAEEGVRCFEQHLYRSAVVLSWVGAVALLYDHVLKSHLANFNAEAIRRNPKWKPAKTADDLSKMGEFDFLQILESISVIGKNVKQELEKQLKLRNGCGHPNSLKIAEHTVASHLEILILNVFAVFS